MNKVEVCVDIFGQTIAAGVLRTRGHGRREQATFEYHSSYLADPRAYALDPILPLKTGMFTTPDNRAMFGAFGDVAPDHWGRRVIARAAERELPHSERLTEFDYVIGVRDDMRQGNLRFRDLDTGTFLAQSDGDFPPAIDLERLLAAADQFDSEKPSDEALEQLLAAGTSIGGARPKAVVIDNEGWLCVAKFPRTSTDEWDVMLWEHLVLVLAERCGIRVPHSQLLIVAGKHVLLERRFDRTPFQRIGYVSAMTMLEANEGDVGSYVEIADVIETRGIAVERDLEELWRRVAFNIAITNTDDHLRNHGFLRDSRSNGWNLSPAFDLNPEPRSKQPLLSTAIRPGEQAADIRLLIDVAKGFRLTQDRAQSIMSEINAQVSRWPQLATELGASSVEQQRVGVAFRRLDVG